MRMRKAEVVARTDLAERILDRLVALNASQRRLELASAVLSVAVRTFRERGTRTAAREGHARSHERQPPSVRAAAQVHALHAAEARGEDRTAPYAGRLLLIDVRGDRCSNDLAYARLLLLSHQLRTLL